MLTSEAKMNENKIDFERFEIFFSRGILSMQVCIRHLCIVAGIGAAPNAIQRVQLEYFIINVIFYRPFSAKAICRPNHFHEHSSLDGFHNMLKNKLTRKLQKLFPMMKKKRTRTLYSVFN